jgi:hypothetical protein
MLQTFSDEGEIPYGITQVQALDVSDEFVYNRKVCVVDSGYDINHADLQTEFVTGTSGGAGNWDEPVNSHGTHCAGTIAAIGNNDGVLGVVRSGKMNLHIVRVFGDDGGWAWSSSLIQAVSASSFSKGMFYFILHCMYCLIAYFLTLLLRFKHALMLDQISLACRLVVEDSVQHQKLPTKICSTMRMFYLLLQRATVVAQHILIQHHTMLSLA